MPETYPILPTAVYGDGQIRLLLGLTSDTLARERREGRLRHLRIGRRTIYLGQWVLDWLEAGAAPRPTGEVAARA